VAFKDELAYTTAAELAARIRRRDLSPVEVVEAYIQRIEERNPSLNAFVYEGFDDARRRAREAEEALTSGGRSDYCTGCPRR
jgi:amidase